RFLACAAADLAHHDEPGMDAEAHGDTRAVMRLQVRVEGVHSPKNPEASPYGSLGIVLMRLRKAKVDEQAITEILRNVSVKTLDDLRARGMVGAHHRPQVLGIELTSEYGRVHQVAEEDGELAPLGVRRAKPYGACQAHRVLSERHRG